MFQHFYFQLPIEFTAFEQDYVGLFAFLIDTAAQKRKQMRERVSVGTVTKKYIEFTALKQQQQAYANKHMLLIARSSIANIPHYGPDTKSLYLRNLCWRLILHIKREYKCH